MRVRHKPPTLVSMWMLDVFCCALGCMILLWVLESLGSNEQAKRAKTALTDLVATRTALADARKELADTAARLNAALDDVRGRLAAMTTDRDDARKKLVAATAAAENTRKDLAVATADVIDTKKKLASATTDAEALKDELLKAEALAAARAEELRKRDKAVTTLAERVASAATAADDLQKLLRDRQKEVEAMTARARDAEQRLADLDAKLRAAVKDVADARAAAADARATASANAKTTAADVAAARDAEKRLRQEVADAHTQIIDLQGDKKRLADKFDRLRIDSENKFAGIALTGKSVVFVVDYSGSMRLKSDRPDDEDPTKWAGVVETVGKVARSIPDLDRFQLVIFSEKASHPLGDGKWVAYKGEESVRQITDTLKKTRPDGGTNLHAGLELAFKLRADGLDTVYLFSDGLPSLGEPLTPEQDRTLSGAKRTELLTRHLRQQLAEWNRPRDTKRVRINAVGFYYDSPEVGSFLWSLAREHDGSFVGMSRP